MTAPEMPKQMGAGLIKSITGTFKKALKDVKRAVVGSKAAPKRKPAAKKASKAKKAKK